MAGPLSHACAIFTSPRISGDNAQTTRTSVRYVPSPSLHRNFRAGFHLSEIGVYQGYFTVGKSYLLIFGAMWLLGYNPLGNPHSTSVPRQVSPWLDTDYPFGRYSSCSSLLAFPLEKSRQLK